MLLSVEERRWFAEYAKLQAESYAEIAKQFATLPDLSRGPAVMILEDVIRKRDSWQCVMDVIIADVDSIEE